MIFGQFKNEIAEWFDLLEQKASRLQTVAEKVVSEKIKFLHEVLSNLEAQAVVLDNKTAAEIRKVVAEVKGETHELVVRLDTALAHAAKAAEARVKSQPKAPVPEPLPDSRIPASSPAGSAAPGLPTEPASAPVVDVTSAVPEAAPSVPPAS